jgi:hypothetical protein
MILYHFTAARFIESIKREGITLGAVLTGIKNGKPILQQGYLWLTVNIDCHDQEWCKNRVTIPYDRSAFRITVDVPFYAEKRVINWLDFCNSGRVQKEVVELLNAYGDPENWRLFRGYIPPQWFKFVDRKNLVQPYRAIGLAR